MLRSPTRLFAAALVLALGACKARPMDDTTVVVDSTANADTSQKSASAPAPAPSDAPPATCELGHALEAWGDSVLAEKRYGVYVTVRLAHMEVESQSTGRLPSTADTTATASACDAARERRLEPFLEAYRRGMPATVLTQDVVRTLGETAGPIARSIVNDTTQIDSPAGDTAKQQQVTDTTTKDPAPEEEIQPVQQVEVPPAWLAALIALITIAGAALIYALWNLSQRLDEWMRPLHDTVKGQTSQLASIKAASDQISSSARTLTEGVESVSKQLEQQGVSLFETKRQTLDELKRVHSVLASPAKGTGSSSGGSRDAWDEDDAENQLGADRASLGNADWEEATVDIQPTPGGLPSIHASPHGVFMVRWVHGSGEARLSVDPDMVLSAAHGDKLNAAFRCREAPRGTGHYHTTQPARCTWDPTTSRGKITRPGRVEEVG